MTFSRIEPDSETLLRIHRAEEQFLAPYAMRTSSSRGRRYPEPPHPYRTVFQRDRDRIIHSAGFRRLAWKTQVFVGQPNDHQRTRLTHSLEVAQIARTIARALRANEDLTEAIALAHDLGHPPFGHAGERALATLMAAHGGFEHNRQGLRLAERLEQRYPSFDGSNLSYEVLESLALRCHDKSHPDLAEFGPEEQMLLESQIVDAADSIAYGTHDIDDSLQEGLIEFDDLRELELWRRAEERSGATYGTDLSGEQLTRGVIRSLIDWQVGSLLTESQSRLQTLRSALEVKRSDHNMIALEPEVASSKEELTKFLLERVYRNEQVVHTTHVAERMISQLFEELVRDPTSLPERFRKRLDAERAELVVCDFVAGMTDRFAQNLHRCLFEP